MWVWNEGTSVDVELVGVLLDLQIPMLKGVRLPETNNF